MRGPYWLALPLLALAGCVAEEPQASPTPSPEPEAAFECPQVPAFRLADLNVTFETSKGAIGAVLYAARSPVTVCNFLRYVVDDFYDQTVWHRICTHVIQAGGQNPFTNEQKPTREPIKNEAPESQLRNYKSTLGMARTSDPDSATSHFFLNLKDNTYLDYDGQYAPGYAVFGNVTRGWAVVEDIARSTTVPDPPTTGCAGRPVPGAETVIRDIKIEDA